jgi:hypothetical protein
MRRALVAILALVTLAACEHQDDCPGLHECPGKDDCRTLPCAAGLVCLRVASDEWRCAQAGNVDARLPDAPP